MRFLSTRGSAPRVSFREALFAGMAPDGGLYVPEALDPIPFEQLGGASLVESSGDFRELVGRQQLRVVGSGQLLRGVA